MSHRGSVITWEWSWKVLYILPRVEYAVRFQHPDGKKTSSEQGKLRRGVCGVTEDSGKRKTEDKKKTRGTGSLKMSRHSQTLPKTELFHQHLLSYPPLGSARPPWPTWCKGDGFSRAELQLQAYFPLTHFQKDAQCGLQLVPAVKDARHSLVPQNNPHPIFLFTFFSIMLFYWILCVSLRHYNLFLINMIFHFSLVCNSILLFPKIHLWVYYIVKTLFRM